MRYTVKKSLRDFEAWSGGKVTLDTLLEHSVVDEAEEYICMIMDCSEEPLTQIEINDILWFDCDEIYRYCGIYNAVYGVTDENDEEEE